MLRYRRSSSVTSSCGVLWIVFGPLIVRMHCPVSSLPRRVISLQLSIRLGPVIWSGMLRSLSALISLPGVAADQLFIRLVILVENLLIGTVAVADHVTDGTP